MRKNITLTVLKYTRMCTCMCESVSSYTHANARTHTIRSIYGAYIYVMVGNVSYFRAYSRMIDRPFEVRYDPYTQTVNVLDNPVIGKLQEELSVLACALGKV